MEEHPVKVSYMTILYAALEKTQTLHCKYYNPSCRKFKFTLAFLKAIGSFAMATASLLFVMLEVESGLSGGEESISRGPSLSLTSVGVCRAGSFESKIQAHSENCHTKHIS